MPNHAEIADQLLRDAADFFKNMAGNNKELAPQMTENAAIFEQMADLLAKQPTGQIDDKSHGALAGRLLKDAANFFRALGKQNPPIEEQMNQNADVYEAIGELVAADPLGVME